MNVLWGLTLWKPVHQYKFPSLGQTKGEVNPISLLFLFTMWKGIPLIQPYFKYLSRLMHYVGVIC